MGHVIQVTGGNGAVQIFGVKLVGVTAENGKKLLFTVCFVVVVVLVGLALRRLVRFVLRTHRNERVTFWMQQVIRLSTAVVLILGFVSIWFDDPTRLATALGLVTAGLAFALQKVITALAAYFVVLWGKTFNVGDRISMGGVRGDVIGLGFVQTTIMEMGQPPVSEGNDPTAWVRSRQYTGRIVTVTNDKIFQEPVYNYTREFPYIWDEMAVPITFAADRRRAEEIMLEVAGRHTVHLEEMSLDAQHEMQRRYAVTLEDMQPRVYYRLTSNWLEMTVRYICLAHGTRELKDAMSRDLLDGFDRAGIGIASTTFDIVGLPTVRVQASGFNGQGGKGVGYATEESGR